MSTPYPGAIASTIATLPFSCFVVKEIIRNHYYKTKTYCSDTYVLREVYENLSPSQKVIKGLAQISLAALSVALINSGMAGIGQICRLVSKGSLQKFAGIGALVGVILGILYEPKVADFIVYNIYKTPYNQHSHIYMGNLILSKYIGI